MDQRIAPPFFDPAETRAALAEMWRRHGQAGPALREELLSFLKKLVQDARAAAREGL